METLERAIREEIRRSGPIPFARFMELCLYHPEHGYYTRGLGGGGGRDYVTSSGLHHAYGACLARQAEEMWSLLGRPERFRFVEFGPGEGHFACDFLRAAAARPEFARALDVVLVETSPALRDRQARRVAGLGLPHSGPLGRWSSLEDLLREGPAEGCLFANEVLDAFPVHRVVGAPGGPREIRVAERDGDLVEEIGPLSSSEMEAWLAAVGVRLEPGQEIDLAPGAARFVERAAGLLRSGWFVVVDYGRDAPDLYHPERRRGTLLAYHRHRASEDFLRLPGEQDLTAHVDFTAVERAARAAGLRLAGRASQSRFLLALGALDFFEASDLAGREALKDLVLPDRMGGVFRVLILAAGRAPDRLRGLEAPQAPGPAAARPATMGER